MLIIICIMLYICSVLHAEIILKMYKMIFLKRNRFSHRTVSNVLWLPSVRKNWVLFVYWEKYIKRSAVFRLFMITRFSIVFFKNDRVFSCNYNGCNDYNGYNTWVLKVGHYCRCLQHQILLNYWCQCRHRQWYGKRRWSSSSPSLPLHLLLLLPQLLLILLPLHLLLLSWRIRPSLHHNLLLPAHVGIISCSFPCCRAGIFHNICLPLSKAKPPEARHNAILLPWLLLAWHIIYSNGILATEIRFSYSLKSE
mgnify:CR=1 FL=1